MMPVPTAKAVSSSKHIWQPELTGLVALTESEASTDIGRDVMVELADKLDVVTRHDLHKTSVS
jgi:hypothetical protein